MPKASFPFHIGLDQLSVPVSFPQLRHPFDQASVDAQGAGVTLAR